MSPEERTPIEAGVQRMRVAMEQQQQRQQAMMEQWVQRSGWPQSRKARRRLERQLRRGGYGEEWEKRSAGQGVVFLVAAAALAYMAMSGAVPWWIIFAAFWLAMSGIRRVARYSRQSEAKRAPNTTTTVASSEPQKQSEPMPAQKVSEPEVQTPADPTLARIDDVCGRLLNEVRRGPEILRDVVRRPEETVKALRDGCHALAKREQELRSLVTPEDDARLLREREQLTKRLQAERDDVTRQRLQGALEALDDQRKQRSELMVSAGRMEAERTRLAFTLENLYTQVLRVRSADASSAEVAGKGLRQSLDRLGGEIGALAEALESVHSPEAEGPEASPVLPPSVRETRVGEVVPESASSPSGAAEGSKTRSRG
jgi:hypothetical protein